jgi:phage terminase large subunit-like protein
VLLVVRCAFANNERRLSAMRVGHRQERVDTTPNGNVKAKHTWRDQRTDTALVAVAVYPRWADDGLIEATVGNVVDFRAVEDKIRELCDEFDVQEIAFDPHMARNILNNLLEDGFPAVEMRQGWVTMAPAIKELERTIVGRRLTHGGHEVLRWNFSNIATETDKAGNKSFHKGKSRDRIDGAQATAMAVGRASAGESSRSIYEGDDRPDGLRVV